MVLKKIAKATNTHMISPLVSLDGDKEIVIVVVVTSASTTWGRLGGGGPVNKRTKVERLDLTYKSLVLHIRPFICL